MIVSRIYEWAKCQPEKTAVIWNHVSVSYLSFANAIQATIEFFQQENLPAGRTAIVLVYNLLDAWLIIMALRALGLNTISVTSIPAANALKIRDVACIIITQTEAAARPGLVSLPGHRPRAGSRRPEAPRNNASLCCSAPRHGSWPAVRVSACPS